MKKLGTGIAILLFAITGMEFISLPIGIVGLVLVILSDIDFKK